MAARNHWHRLPDELVEHILSRLVAADVLACRCVCNHWNSLLRSHSFLRLATATSPYFLAHSTGHSLAAYCPDSRRWRNLPLPPCASISRAAPLASSRGLILFSLRRPHYPRLLVVNPLTSAVRRLPLTNTVRFIEIVGMSDDDDGFYRIMLTGTAEPSTHECVTELYDSRTGSWVVHSNSDDDYLQFWYEKRVSWLAGFFYCLADPLGFSDPIRLISYDLANRRWEKVGMAMAPGYFNCRSLVVCGERLLLVGITVNDRSTAGELWEVDRVRKEWVKVTTVPDEFLVGVTGLSKCVGYGNILCFNIHGGMKWIMYDLLDGAWQWLAENCKGREEHGQELVRNCLVGLLFEPSLSASV